jgi:hypothetical protein
MYFINHFFQKTTLDDYSIQINNVEKVVKQLFSKTNVQATWQIVRSLQVDDVIQVKVDLKELP